MTTLTIQIPDKKADLAKQILKELGAVVISGDDKKESPYDAQFVAKIKKSDEDIKHGRTKKISIDDLWK